MMILGGGCTSVMLKGCQTPAAIDRARRYLCCAGRHLTTLQHDGLRITSVAVHCKSKVEDRDSFDAHGKCAPARGLSGDA